MPFTLNSPLPAKGVVVPTQATFTGHKSVPYFAIATNSLRPQFRLFEDEVEFAVLKLHRRKLGDIELVDAINWRLNKSVTLIWNDTPWTFTAGVVTLPRLIEVLRFLRRKEVPLSGRAARLLNEN